MTVGFSSYVSFAFQHTCKNMCSKHSTTAISKENPFSNTRVFFLFSEVNYSRVTWFSTPMRTFALVTFNTLCPLWKLIKYINSSVFPCNVNYCTCIYEYHLFDSYGYLFMYNSLCSNGMINIHIPTSKVLMGDLAEPFTLWYWCS